MRDAHNQMDEYLATKPHDWYAASLHIIIKDHLNTREMLLYQDPGSPQGHFNAVPRTMLPQRSVQPEEQESMDMFDLRLQVLHTSSATCPNAKFLFILMCDAGAILLTTVEDNSNCPDKETLDEVINSFTMPLGRYSCEAYLNMTSYFIYNF
ncbi:uncharacterized protein LOC105385072 [Plutella xylostella]|nr:uncharacterized protein LOC105385072 [Plutella xylostella]